MSTAGFQGYYVETRDYKATAAFWKALGFESVFETDHASGQWRHPAGGPYVFIAEQHETPLTTHPILQVIDSVAFERDSKLGFTRAFTQQHWDVVEAIVVDPDGRQVSLQSPSG